MAGEVSEDSTVSFTVKELLTEQTGILREIKAAVDGKADKADLIPLAAKLESHGGRIQTIEDERKAERAVAEQKSKTRGRAAWVVAAVLVPFSTTLIFVFH